MNLTRMEKIGMIVDLIAANIFLFISKPLFYDLLERGFSWSPGAIFLVGLCYFYANLIGIFLFSPIYTLWIA